MRLNSFYRVSQQVILVAILFAGFSSSFATGQAASDSTAAAMFRNGLDHSGVYPDSSPMSEIQTCDMTSRDLAGMKKKGQTGNGVRTGRDGRKFQRQSSPFPAYAV
jgi:hypothetical protein